MAIFKQKPKFIDMSDILEASSKVLENNIKLEPKLKPKDVKPALETKLKKDPSVINKKVKKSETKVETYLGCDIKWI